MMRHPIHDHLDQWLDASFREELDDTQKEELRQHLANCEACLARVCNTQTLDHALAVFDAEDLFPQRFDERALETFHTSVSKTRIWFGAHWTPRLTMIVRTGFAAGLFMMLGIRFAGFKLVDATPGWRRGFSAFSQIFLRQPSYDGASATLSPDETLFVAFHRLAAFYAGMAIWLLGSLLVCALIVSAWRRHMLRPIHQGDIPQVKNGQEADTQCFVHRMLCEHNTQKLYEKQE